MLCEPLPELPGCAKERSLAGSGTVLCCHLGLSLATANTFLCIPLAGLGLGYKGTESFGSSQVSHAGVCQERLPGSPEATSTPHLEQLQPYKLRSLLFN